MARTCVVWTLKKVGISSCWENRWDRCDTRKETSPKLYPEILLANIWGKYLRLNSNWLLIPPSLLYLVRLANDTVQICCPKFQRILTYWLNKGHLWALFTINCCSSSNSSNSFRKKLILSTRKYRWVVNMIWTVLVFLLSNHRIDPQD